MNFVNLLLADAPVANWISKSFPIFQTILIILIALLAVAIIVCVLLNPSNSDGGSNAKIANIIEYGKHGQPAKPFLKPAKSATKIACIEKMKQKFQEEVDKI